MHPRQTLTQFDAYLTQQGLRLEAVVIGGAAMSLLGLTSRTTKDCDILHPLLPDQIAQAAREFAQRSRLAGEVLADDWLNNGPNSLVQVLPPDWQTRLQIAFSGQAMTLFCLGRMELLMSKLFALCDRGLDLPDCMVLAPTPEEMTQILPWLEQQDGNPSWPAHVRAITGDLLRRLGHGP